jgi:uncharacterized protein
MDFVNRNKELKLLSNTTGGLIVVTGRRRIGKTRLLGRWLEHSGGQYCQAIEASPEQQLQQLSIDLTSLFNSSFVPQNWEQFFELLNSYKQKLTLCIDEFPYLVTSDPSLPSRFQRWIDHSMKPNTTLILCGSSQRMMYSSVLAHDSPLFGRSTAILNLEPMSYLEFCQATKCKVNDKNSFRLFSLVGGIPKYWELIGKERDPVASAENLYFGFSAYLEGEPRRMLRDERIEGIQPLSVLEAVGRGASRPTEIASRMGVKQTSLSKVLQLLVEASLLHREIPFGESSRSTKRTCYSIRDESLAFWFSTYSPHRSRWHTYSNVEKLKLVDLHTSKIFEQTVRAQHPNASRYWDARSEFDVVYHPGTSQKHINILEVKWGNLNTKQKQVELSSLEQAVATHPLATKYQVKELLVVCFEDYVRSLG